MNETWLSRTKLLIGNEQIKHLKDAHVLIVGLGGVGAYVAEQICRAGVGKMSLVDGDTIDASNINRQLPATTSNVGKSKSEVMGKRLVDINPKLKIRLINEYIKDERIPKLLQEDDYDFVVDAIDTLTPKVLLIEHSLANKLPIVSAMGAGGKTDPGKVQIADISKSYNCKLARMLRKRLHKLGIYKGVQVVFSPETVCKQSVILEENTHKKSNVGSISYMPALFGCLMASVVIKTLIGKK